MKYCWSVEWAELNKKGNKEQLYFHSSTVFEHVLSNPLPLFLDKSGENLTALLSFASLDKSHFTVTYLTVQSSLNGNLSFISNSERLSFPLAQVWTII